MSHRDKSCTRKQAHDTKRAAKLAIDFMIRQFGLHRSTLCPYRCVYCRHWHIGHRRPDLERSTSAIEITAAGNLL